jgi:cytochrome c-type biogenesis protein CcmH
VKRFGIASLLFGVLSMVHASALYPLSTAKQEAQFQHLLRDLRCLVCQNQDLADSSAGLANDLRLEVYNRVKEGQSDHEIIDYLTARYGDFILFNPPVKSLTALLWLAPLLFLTLGMIVFWRKFRLVGESSSRMQ